MEPGPQLLPRMGRTQPRFDRPLPEDRLVPHLCVGATRWGIHGPRWLVHARLGMSRGCGMRIWGASASTRARSGDPACGGTGEAPTWARSADNCMWGRVSAARRPTGLGLPGSVAQRAVWRRRPVTSERPRPHRSARHQQRGHLPDGGDGLDAGHRLRAERCAERPAHRCVEARARRSEGGSGPGGVRRVERFPDRLAADQAASAHQRPDVRPVDPLGPGSRVEGGLVRSVQASAVLPSGGSGHNRGRRREFCRPQCRNCSSRGTGSWPRERRS